MARATWAFGLCLLTSACSLLSQPDIEQCDQASDCARFGPGLTCKEHVCTKPKGAPDLPDAGAGGDRDAAIDASVIDDAAAGGCTQGSDCKGDAPHICREQRCVQLTSEDCTRVVPESAVRDDAIFVGYMGPLEGEFAALGLPIEQGAELALEELEQTAKGIPLGKDGARHKLAMITCHDLTDPARAARHLIEQVGVPAIIGPAFSGVLLDVATEVAIPNKTLLVSASATSPALSELDDDGLVWRTAPSDAIQAVPLATLISRYEERIRDEQALGIAPIRVAVVAKGEAYGRGLFDTLTELMIFNGKTVTENGANFLPISYPDPAVGAVDYSKYVASVVDFAPHLVVLLGTSEIIGGLLTPIEASWPKGPLAAARPYYLLPDGGHDPSILAASEKSDALRIRLRGTVPGRKGEAFDSFALRFRARFDAEPGTFADSAYDAGYLLAYALAFAGEDTLTGPSIASGLAELSTGTKVLAEPGGINGAISRLRTGKSINFEGAAGSLDFDPKSGEAPADIEIWCVTESGGKAAFQSSGEYYDAQLGEIAGDNVDCDF